MRKECVAGRREFLPAGFLCEGKESIEPPKRTEFMEKCQKWHFFYRKNVKNKEEVIVKMSDMRYSIGEEVQTYAGKKD